MFAPIHLRKLFIGGLDYSTTEEELRDHFSAFGEVIDAVVKKDQSTCRSRGFGFVTFQSMDSVDAVQRARPHKITGRTVDTKRAVPQSEMMQTVSGSSTLQTTLNTANNRLFIGGLLQEHKEDVLEQYFSRFGRVTSVNVLYTTEGQHRGFAFVEFDDYDPVDKILLAKHHSIKGHTVDVKKAIGKNDMNKIKNMMSTASNIAAQPVVTPVASIQVPHATSAAHSNGVTWSKVFPATAVYQAAAAATSAFFPSATPQMASPSSNGAAHVLAGGIRVLSSSHPGMGAQAASHTFNVPSSQVPPAGTRSGWQYTVTSNCEVLRSTGSGAAPCTRPSADSRSSSTERDKTAEASRDVNMDEPSSAAAQDRSSCHEDTRLDTCPPNAHILFLEPFCGGSHRQLIETVLADRALFGGDEDACAVFTMPAKKWHWRARTAALYFSQRVPSSHVFKVLFCSATLNLCELLGLRPDLSPLHKVVYFHENQLVYPVRESKERDFQYGYNQILTALAANSLFFNSQYNLESFLREVPRHLNLQKDHRPDTATIAAEIRAKSRVLYFPLTLPPALPRPASSLPLQVLWPHRWEHDKDPDTFFQVLFQLADSGHKFRVSVLGESYSEVPPVFEQARLRLSGFIEHWGFADTRDKYWEILHRCDVVVSTAHHEFFGVAMLEAVAAGCYPLCPNRLVYPELYPKECLYNTQQQLFKALSTLSSRPQMVRGRSSPLIELEPYSWAVLRSQYAEALAVDAVLRSIVKQERV